MPRPPPASKSPGHAGVRPVHPSLHALVWVVVFSAALGAGAAVHLDHPLARRWIGASVNRILAPVLVGRVVIDRIHGLSLRRLNGVDAHVDDARGRTLLRIEGARADVSAWVLVRSLLAGRRDVVVDVPELSVTSVDVDLDSAPDGSPRIARALSPREDSRPTSPGRALHLRLPRVRVKRLTFRAQPSAPFEGTIDGLEGAVRVESGLTAVDVSRGRIVARGFAGAPVVRAEVEGHLTVPPLRARATLTGVVGGIGERAEVTYDDGRIDAVVDVPRTSPEALRTAWASSPVTEPVNLRAEAHGTLSRLEVLLRAGLGTGNVDVRGPIAWTGSAAHGDLVVHASGVDVRGFVPALPASSLAAAADVSFDLAPTGDLQAVATIDFAGGGWAAARLPAAAIRGDVALPSGGLPTADGVVDVAEQGAWAHLVARLAPQGKSLGLAFSLGAGAARLQDLMPVRNLARGSATATATGSIDFGSSVVRAEVSASGEGLDLGGATLADVQIGGRVTGTLGGVSADVDVAGDGLYAGPLALSTFRASGRVSSGPPLIVRDLDVEASGDAAPAHAHASHDAAPAHAHASLVSFASDEIRVDDGAVEGIGAPLTGTMRASARGVLVRATTAGLDLTRLSTFVRTPLTRGTVSFDVDAIVGAGSADGRVSLQVDEAAFSGIEDIDARVQATVRGRSVSGRADASVADVGTLAVRSSSVDIGPGSLVTPAPWRRTWGALDFESRLDLAKLVARLPEAPAFVSKVDGALTFEGRVARDSIDDATPGVDVRVRATGLAFEGRGPVGPWRIEGFEPAVHATVDGDSGATLVRAELRDAEGPLFEVTASSQAVPYAVLFSDEDPAAALRAMPFDAALEIPSRGVDTLPPSLGLGGIGGRIDAAAAWHGSVLSPTIDLTAEIGDARVDPAIATLPIDAVLRGRYDGRRAEAKLRALVRGTEVLDADVGVAARASDVVASLRGAPAAWSASLRASLRKMPLRFFSALYDRQIRGTASGEIAIDGLHDDARGSATFALDGLQVGDVACRAASATMTIGGGAFDGRVRVDHADGFVEGHARFGARWGAAMAPSFDLSAPAQASLSAKQFRAAVLLPFLTGALTELDGRIDGAARVDFDPTSKTVRPQGSLALKGGTFELKSFGNEFHDAELQLNLAPDGVVRIDGASARGLSGTVRAAATARFDAAGMAAARATIRVPAKDPLPLVFDGFQLGQLDGQFDVSIDRAGPKVEIGVDVPSAHVSLPVASSSLDVQPLGDVDNVEIGLRDGPDGFTPVSLDASHDAAPDPKAARNASTIVSIRLGRDVHVSRGANLDVHLEGQPTVTLAGTTSVSGQIRLPSGSIDVQGKPFEIEKGTITFVGVDPSNPQVVLTAGWTAPDNTRVYADLVGPLKTAQLRLRSSPARPQSEIVALILYGTSDQYTSTAGPSAAVNATTNQAAPFASAATQPLNQAVGRLLRTWGLGGVTTKIDQSQMVARPEVEVQIARNLSLQVAWVLGAPPPGTNPDSTLVTLDWNFLRRWSLETTVGDTGTSIFNLVWQQRY